MELKTIHLQVTKYTKDQNGCLKRFNSIQITMTKNGFWAYVDVSLFVNIEAKKFA
jgi:hypothetical protein